MAVGEVGRTGEGREDWGGKGRIIREGREGDGGCEDDKEGQVEEVGWGNKEKQVKGQYT